jgi:hypothetical protein
MEFIHPIGEEMHSVMTNIGNIQEEKLFYIKKKENWHFIHYIKNLNFFFLKYDLKKKKKKLAILL